MSTKGIKVNAMVRLSSLPGRWLILARAPKTGYWWLQAWDGEQQIAANNGQWWATATAKEMSLA